jgi:alpha-tubulin suppressor-like RCC1 family protein
MNGARRFLHGAWAILLGTFAGCSGGETVAPPPPPSIPVVPVASVAVTPQTVNVMVGESAQLTAVVTDTGGHVLTGQTVSWVSSAPQIATVSASGLVRAMSRGSVEIAATAEGKIGSAVATVGLVFMAVTAGVNHTCGLTIANTVYCWGDNSRGQLGIGSAGPSPVCQGTTSCTAPLPVSGGMQFTSVSAGWEYSCGVTTAGAGLCWGSGYGGELGTGDTTDSPAPALVAGGLGLVTVSAGSHHACAIAATGDLYCWGSNIQGQLGDATSVQSAVPVLVVGGHAWMDVSAGDAHTCGIVVGDAAFCWGFAFYGQVGDGSPTSVSLPAAVAGGVSFTMVSAGYEHTCAISTRGAAYCWGRTGGIGDGTTLDTYRYTPVPVLGGLSFASLSAGSSSTCAAATDGSAYCWGTEPSATARGLQFATISVSTAGFHTCGVTPTGTVYCWGNGSVGQLGDSTTTDSAVPVKVAGQR